MPSLNEMTSKSGNMDAMHATTSRRFEIGFSPNLERNPNQSDKGIATCVMMLATFIRCSVYLYDLIYTLVI